MKLAPIIPQQPCPVLRPFKAIYPIFMTEKKRQGDILKAIGRLPRGALVILREYEDPDRLKLGVDVRRETRKRGLILLVASDERLARRIKADGLHLPAWRLKNPPRSSVPWLSAACHTRADLARAKALGIPLKLTSPVFTTRSHPGAKTLGIHRFARLTKGHDGVIALGGINRRTVKHLPGRSLAGYAAIDMWNAQDQRG